jgi:hypothetical protein
MKSLALGTLFFIFIIFGCQTADNDQSLSKEKLIEKGEYLVTVAGCNDCHSPKKLTPHGPVPDTNLLLSGHPQNSVLPEIDKSAIGPGKWVLMNENLTAFAGPWGMTFSANLTPDEQTGLGLWNEEHFINAMRTGKHMGMGRPIMPPMPWFNLTQANDEDLIAIFTYLKSIKPVKNAVPGPVPPDQIGQ